MILRLLLSAVTTAALAGSALARSEYQPVPVPLPAPLTPVPIGVEHAGNCAEVYLNESAQTGYYFAPGAGEELADDLHTRAIGDWPLCAFDFGYFKPTAGLTDAVVTLYDGDPSDSGPGGIIAGPFLLQGLPGGGAYAFHIEVPNGLVRDDVWMGVEFSTGDAGLLTFDPASIGFSHDRDHAYGTVFQSPSGGNPPASYFLGLYASPPTGTQASTWGEVKSIYR